MSDFEEAAHVRNRKDEKTCPVGSGALERLTADGSKLTLGRLGGRPHRTDDVAVCRDERGKEEREIGLVVECCLVDVGWRTESLAISVLV